MASKLPKKLKEDSITETIFEIRFQSEDPDEIVLGRLLNASAWRDWEKTRLPTAEIPPQMRAQVESLKFQALYDIRDREGKVLVKVGPNVISCHVIGNYPGWSEFLKLISKSISAVFSKGAPKKVLRLGLRYINALTEEKHFVANLYALTVVITVRDEQPSDHINLNYTVRGEDGLEALVRVASPSVVSGNIQENATVYIDVDVRTTEEPGQTDRNSVIRWVKKAHTFEKEQYFKLLPDDIIEILRED